MISLLSGLLIYGQSPVDDLRWHLVWQDNFDSLNTNIWKIEDNFDHYGSNQVAISKNVFVEEGSLICEINQESYSCPPWAIEPNWHCVNQYKSGAPYAYTMGWVQSKAAYNIQYGYLEASIYFSYQPGLWPAFWTFLGDDVKGKNGAEIDIAEMLGELGNQTITTNIHNDQSVDYFQKHTPEGYRWDSWHKYAIEWNPNAITWYLDDIPIRVIYNHDIVDPVKIIFGIGLRPNVSLKNTEFPQKMFVDYIRVYQLNEE